MTRRRHKYDNYNYNDGFTIRTRSEGLTYPGYIKTTMFNIISFPNNYKKYLILRNSDEFIKTAFDLQDYKELIIKMDAQDRY